MVAFVSASIGRPVTAASKGRIIPKFEPCQAAPTLEGSYLRGADLDDYIAAQYGLAYSEAAFLRKAAKATEKSAYHRMLDFSLTVEDLAAIWISQKGLCALSGRKLLMARGRKLERFSIDRIKSDFGYIRGNVQFLCLAVNMMKSNYPQEEFLQWCASIAAHTQSTC